MHRHRRRRARRPLARLFAAEVAKIGGSAMIWIFLAACMALNTVTVVSAARAYGAEYDYASRTARSLGSQVDANFDARLSGLPNSALHRGLHDDVQSLGNPFDGFDAEATADEYAQVLNEQRHPYLALQLRLKAGHMGERAVHLARTKAGLSLYAAGTSEYAHRTLSGLVMAIAVQSAVLGSLIMLYATGFEAIHRTTMLAAATRTGRSSMTVKLMAGLALAVGCSVLLAIVAVLAYLICLDTSGIWGSSVSSGFNTMTQAGVESPQPFLTWTDFSVGGYWLASLGLALAFGLVFAVFAGAVGAMTQNIYRSSGIVAGVTLLLGVVTLRSLMRGDWVLLHATSMQPLYTLLTSGRWFTAMGLDEAFPWQESAAVAVSLLYCLAGLALARRRFTHVDLV